MTQVLTKCCIVGYQPVTGHAGERWCSDGLLIAYLQQNKSGTSALERERWPHWAQ